MVLPAEVLEAAKADTVRMDTLVEIDFADAPLRMWNGSYTIMSGSREWAPAHGAIEFGNLVLGGSLEQETVTVGLGDAREETIALAFRERGLITERFIYFYAQLFDQDWTPIFRPLPFWWGIVGPPRGSQSETTISDGGARGISIVATNAMYTRARPPGGRYTDLDQRRRSPDDEFCQSTAEVPNKELIWPKF